MQDKFFVCMKFNIIFRVIYALMAGLIIADIKLHVPCAMYDEEIFREAAFA